MSLITNKRERNMSNLIGIGLLLGFILPHSLTFLQMVNPLLCILLWALKREKLISNAALLVFASLLISILSNITQISSLKPLLTCVTIMMYVLCFPFTDMHVKVPPGYFYIILIIVFLSQIAYLLDISFITRMLDTVYPIQEGNVGRMYEYMRRNITVDNMLNYRLGGLYRNPNQCARSLCLLLVSFLLLFRGKKAFWFAALCIGCIILTGSRTGFVIAALIVVAYIFYCINVSLIIKLGVLFVAISGVLVMFIAGSGTFRSVDIASGMSGSASVKFETFKYYLQNEISSFRLLFGYLDPDRFQSGYGFLDFFDADYGYLVYNYGFIGFATMLLYNVVLFFKMTKQGRVFFIVLLWMVTSTIFCSYRAVFIYFLLLSLVYGQYRKSIGNSVK